MLLRHLNIAFDITLIEVNKLKSWPYTNVNPNGRVPSIEDPNTNITLWESGAIIQYLVEKYDTSRSISFTPGSAAAHHANQWLFFQVSGQGPYMGQAGEYTLVTP